MIWDKVPALPALPVLHHLPALNTALPALNPALMDPLVQLMRESIRMMQRVTRKPIVLIPPHRIELGTKVREESFGNHEKDIW